MSAEKEPASDEILLSLAHRGAYAHSLSQPEADTINWLANRELQRRQQPPYIGAEPPLLELARSTIEVLNWHVTEHNGAKIFERIVLRHAQPDGSFRYHVYRVVGRSTVAMYDVFELPSGYRRGPIAQDDLKPVWPPGRDYNREG